MKRSVAIFCTLLGGIIGSPGQIPAQGQTVSALSSQANGAAGLIGTWRVTINIQDCQTRAPLGMPFYSFLTFTPGGILGGATMNPAFQPGQRSSDFGAWKRTDWNTYSATGQAFVLFSAGPFTMGVQTLTHKITLNQNYSEFTDDATLSFADLIGNAINPPQGCAAATGKRVE